MYYADVLEVESVWGKEERRREGKKGVHDNDDDDVPAIK